MTKNSALYGLAALAAGILFDVFFYNRSVGISFPIFVLVLAGLLLTFAQLRNIQVARRNYLLLAASVALAVLTAFRDEPLSRFAAGLASLLLLWLVTVTVSSANWVHYRFLDYALTALRFVGDFLTKLAGYFFPQKGENPEAGSSQALRRNGMAVLRGLLLAVPIVFVLAMLLASADPVFGDRLLNIFDTGRLTEYIARLIRIAAIAAAVLGTLLAALESSRPTEKPDPQKRWLKPFLGWIETTIILGGVVLLFVSFVIIQFQYFFGGDANIHINGFTYAEYARQGFGELIFVSFLVLALYVALSVVTREESPWQRTLFTVLSVIMNGLVLVILYSAYSRMMLYQDAYGFTRARTQVFITIFWLAVLLIGTIVFELARRRYRFPLLVLVTLIGLAFSMVGINVDGTVLRRNIDRVMIVPQGSSRVTPFDANYLRLLSWDAVPAMVYAYQESVTPVDIRSALRDELACRSQEMQAAQPQSWMETHVGRDNAYRLLQANPQIWQDYQFATVDGILQFTHDGVKGDCTVDAFFD